MQESNLELDIFFIADQVNRRNIKVIHCPTDEMIGDFMKKPLQGKKLLKFREAIWGIDFVPEAEYVF